MNVNLNLCFYKVYFYIRLFMTKLLQYLFIIFFFFQAEDGIRDTELWLEFRRVLFRSGGKEKEEEKKEKEKEKEEKEKEKEREKWKRKRKRDRKSVV